MLSLSHAAEDHLECVAIHLFIQKFIGIMNSVVDACDVGCDIGQKHFRELILLAVFHTVLVLNKIGFMIHKYTLPQIVAVIAAELQEVLFQNPPQNAFERDAAFCFSVGVPERGVGVLDRIDVHSGCRTVGIDLVKKLDRGLVIDLPSQIE